MSADFDRHAENYRDIINREVAITGESFEYFIELRLSLVERDLAAASADTPRRILDFGCGIGATEVMLRRHFPEAHLDGVDPSPESIKAARELAVSNAAFEVTAGLTLPFADATFDLIYSNGTFHHIAHTEHDAVFRELARVLKPGGHAFIFENNPLNPLIVRAMRRSVLDRDTETLLPWYLRARERASGLMARPPRYYVFLPGFLRAFRWAERYLSRVPLGAQYYVWGTKPVS